MSSLLKSHQLKISRKVGKNCEKLACWEFFSCSKVLCPAHGRDEEDCWHIQLTQCSGKTEGDLYQKFSTCLACSYFQERGKMHPEGWDDFLVRQIHP
ncbi:MAG: hypothetical protein V2B13_09490, partial [Pseudomonadota bacterium]